MRSSVGFLAALQLWSSTCNASPLAQAPPTPSPLPSTATKAKMVVERPLSAQNPTRPEVKFESIRYGPFFLKAQDMQDAYWTWNLRKPCEDCYITAMEADLQFEDGRSANVEHGAWLHHIVLHNGLGMMLSAKMDLVCSGTVASWGMGYPHRIFASGNERRIIRLNSDYKAGLVVDKGDQFQMVHDILNLATTNQTFYTVIKYEWVPKNTPGYGPARTIWMDITGCSDGNMPGREGVYEYKSPGWKSTITGRLIASSGHTHDGGDFTTLYINDQPICKSDQHYGTKPQFFEKGGIINVNSPDAMHGFKSKDHGHPKTIRRDLLEDINKDKTTWHISDVSTCHDFANLKKGDVLKIGATYNTTAHKLNMPIHGHETAMWAKEKFAPVMGIAPVYIAEVTTPH